MQSAHVNGTPPPRWVWLAIAGALVLSSVPYLAGILFAGADHVYLWLYPQGQADSNVYYSFIRQAAEGGVFLRNLHTGEPQIGMLFSPLWLALGWVSGLTTLAAPVVFHAARLLLGILFLAQTYRLLERVLPNERQQRIAFFLIAFSSGLGTFFSMGINVHDYTQVLWLLPADQWITESNTFLTLMHSPLFVLSQLLLVLFLRMLLALPARSSPLAFGTLAAFLTLVHPYDAPTLLAVTLVFVILRWWRDTAFRTRTCVIHVGRCVAATLLGILPVLGYFLLIGRLEPAIGGWVQQNVTLAPPPHSYLIGFGLLAPFAVAGAMAWRRTRRPEKLLVFAWAAASLLLLYAPVQVNRRFSNGLHLPLAVLAAVGVDVLWRWIETRRVRATVGTMLQGAVGWLLALGFFFGTLTTVVRAVFWARDLGSVEYLPRPVDAAMRWLDRNTPNTAVTLSHPFLGNVLPAVTGAPVYVGHGHQTLQYAAKRDRVTQWFFRTNDHDAAKAKFLREAGITYLFFSVYERRLGPFNPAEKPYLERVYERNGAAIYRVRSE